MGALGRTVGSRGLPLSRTAERKLAASLFNRTWDLLAQTRRSPEEDEELLHAAHASTYHWYRVGTARNLSIAEWQLARVYAVLRRPDAAVHHAERSLRFARRAHLAPFYVAYGHEALARAYAIARAVSSRNRHLREARRLGAKIRDADDRRMLDEDLATIPWRTRRRTGRIAEEGEPWKAE